MSYRYSIEKSVENGEFSKMCSWTDATGTTWYYLLRPADSVAVLCPESVVSESVWGRERITVLPAVKPVPTDILRLPECVDGHRVVGLAADAFRCIGGLEDPESKWRINPAPKRFSNLYIPDSVEYIGARAFYHCAELENIESKLSAEVVGFASFSCCEMLKQVVFAEIGTKAIRPLAFSGCVKLSSLVLPDGLVSIEQEAFSRCYSLKQVCVPDSVCEMSDNSFKDTSCEVSYPERLGVGASANSGWRIRTHNPIKGFFSKAIKW